MTDDDSEDYENLLEEVRQTLERSGLPSEGYSMQLLRANVGAVNRAISQGAIKSPITRAEWLNAIINEHRMNADG